MAEQFLAEIRIISFGFAPRGWALCNGQLLPINQNQALFSLLGTTYGGDGRVNFGLPDLRGRTPVHVGDGITLGQQAGEQAHTLTTSEMPDHTHVTLASQDAANQGSPPNNYWSSAGSYAPTPNGAMNPLAILPVGGSQPHENTMPFLVVGFIIALQGIFPSAN